MNLNITVITSKYKVGYFYTSFYEELVASKTKGLPDMIASSPLLSTTVTMEFLPLVNKKYKLCFLYSFDDSIYFIIIFLNKILVFTVQKSLFDCVKYQTRNKDYEQKNE